MKDNPKSSLRLIVDKNSYFQKISERISLGEILLNEQVKTVRDYNKFLQDVTDWENFNRQLIKASFNVYNNSHYLEYLRQNVVIDLLTIMPQNEGIDDVAVGSSSLDTATKGLRNSLHWLSHHIKIIYYLEDVKNVFDSKAKNAPELTVQYHHYEDNSVTAGGNITGNVLTGAKDFEIKESFNGNRASKGVREEQSWLIKYWWGLVIPLAIGLILLMIEYKWLSKK
jgi:hypothetical protein